MPSRSIEHLSSREKTRPQVDGSPILEFGHRSIEFVQFTSFGSVGVPVVSSLS